MPLQIGEIAQFVEKHIQAFHRKRIESLQKLNLRDVLRRKNPYLFRAKNISTPEELVKPILDAYLSSQEEGVFGTFLEQLAIFVCSKVYGGWKSSTEGIDLEMDCDEKRYIIVIKSGPNWGNSGQISKMREDFRRAMRVLRTNAAKGKSIVAINGCCYGKDDRPDKGDYMKLCGQRFWSFISGMPELYVEIIEPLGHRARQRNASFMREYKKVVTRFARDLGNEFCLADGTIDWPAIVRLTSAAKDGENSVRE